MQRHLFALGLSLLWLLASSASAAEKDHVIVLDVSGSMWGRVEGTPKIRIAREVVADLVVQWPRERRIGLVAYGHRKAGDCTDIEIVIPVGPIDPTGFAAAVQGLTPRGKTPLTEAVRQAAETLRYRDVPATVILVSDGIESCNADPCALAESLRQGGVDFTVHVIGFDIEKQEDQTQLRCMAEATGGRFLSAAGAAELFQALKQVSRLEPEPIPDYQATLQAPEQVPIGSEFKVQWQGPDLEGDYLSLARPGDRAGKYLSYLVARGHNPADMRAPDEPGSYRLRYVVGASKQIAGSTELRVVDAPASLQAPASAVIGSEIEVAWQGPDNQGDYVTVAAAKAEDKAFGDYAYTRNGSPSRLRMPEQAGEYELRYTTGQSRRVLARRPIQVLESAVRMQAPSSAAMGAELEITWEGPDNPGDYITVVPPLAEDKKFTNYIYTRKGSPSRLRMPEQAGDYELRYVTGQKHRVLARLPIQVQEVVTALEAPASAGIGASVKVQWSGPDGRSDYITVVPWGAEDRHSGNHVYTRHGSPAELRMPEQPGEYEIRYITGKQRRVQARQPILVEAVEAVLEAPPTASIGSSLQVTWSGPGGRNDYITVVPVGSEERTLGNYAYARHGSPSKLRMPEQAGEYEIRYLTGKEKRVLAVWPILLEAVEARLEAPSTGIIGNRIQVVWSGPGNRKDLITVVAAGAPDRKPGNYVYADQGSPSRLTLPDRPGSYEVRYLTANKRLVLARQPVQVEAKPATLEPLSTVSAGQRFEVRWTGPAGYRDRIAIAEPDAAPKKMLDYADIRGGSPSHLKAPDRPGSYELRYITGQTYQVLEILPLRVQPLGLQ